MNDDLKKIENALFWLTDELANLQSHFGMTTGENGEMSRGEFFETNLNAMRKNLCRILGIEFLQ